MNQPSIDHRRHVETYIERIDHAESFAELNAIVNELEERWRDGLLPMESNDWPRVSDRVRRQRIRFSTASG